MTSTDRADGRAPVVFLGPTLPHRRAAGLLPGADLRGPAVIGDVYRAVSGGARVILLVDGCYERVPSVWHKEILWALANGVAVFGAASMGALRAAETAAFGMVGIGTIFADFRAGRLVADDEVAVLHQPALGGYRPLSVALVDIRATARAAVTAGVIREAAAGELLARAARTFYAERDYPALLAGMPDPAERESLRAWLPGGRVERKRDDAVLALRLLASGRRRGTRAAAPFRFAHTHQWQLLVDTEGTAPCATG
ncbi:TfuA-like protein [Saccharothrix australiensis]|uniref:TfuA-like core domain-containing protein n=1 Tax=Saccharothrix australiensis TaxID=2072 RepID=A0A495VY64_9PSEU|nr:TfuA-like protein [Saccharothrix australiensis]RKT54189.1 hypothetical protein C8E97_2803 [Saccharothrix australiensis]